MYKRSIFEIQQANRALGHYWFEPSTKRFFNTRVSQVTFYGADSSTLFVSSEKGPYNAHRLFTVRRSNADGSITTVGDFQGYRSLASALRAAEQRSSREEAIAA
jgi:hypothetical protein